MEAWRRSDTAADSRAVLDGANILQGRGGADVLEGGGGADRFAFRAAEHAGLGAGRDTILDFEGRARPAGPTMASR